MAESNDAYGSKYGSNVRMGQDTKEYMKMFGQKKYKGAKDKMDPLFKIMTSMGQN